MSGNTLNDRPLKMHGEDTVRYQCDLKSLDSSQRKRRAELAARVWSQNRETRELATGFQFRFDFNPILFNNAAELVTLEHLCCPFFDIGLRLERNSGAFWLEITGDSAVKQFLRAEMNLTNTA